MRSNYPRASADVLETALAAAQAAVPECPRCTSPLRWYRLADVAGRDAIADWHRRAAREALAGGAPLRSWYWICGRCSRGSVVTW